MRCDSYDLVTEFVIKTTKTVTTTATITKTMGRWKMVRVEEVGVQSELSVVATMRSVEKRKVGMGLMKERSGKRPELGGSWEGRGVEKVASKRLTKSQRRNWKKKVQGRRERGGKRVRERLQKYVSKKGIDSTVTSSFRCI